MLPSHLNRYFEDRFKIREATSIGGGCINDCYKLDTSTGIYFIKLNSAVTYPGMFEAEKKGLELLASTNTMPIPKILETGEVNGTSFLLMEFIETGKPAKDTMLNFGRNLAALHRHSSGHYGLEYDNYIGSLPQYNQIKDSWGDFFIRMRLLPQLKLAKDLVSFFILDFENLFSKMDSLFPDERPALLHGDLWNGNYIVNTKGDACLVDPAAYYGHREMDIAMTKLFGGFTNEFYEGYNEVYPLESGWRSRIDLCNLYPLLVHVNLFGDSYVKQVKKCLKKYV